MITLTEQITLKCQRCKHEWIYKGKNYYVTSCPHCRTIVTVNKKSNLIEGNHKNV